MRLHAAMDWQFVQILRENASSALAMLCKLLEHALLVFIFLFSYYCLQTARKWQLM